MRNDKLESVKRWPQLQIYKYFAASTRAEAKRGKNRVRCRRSRGLSYELLPELSRLTCPLALIVTDLRCLE